MFRNALQDPGTDRVWTRGLIYVVMLGFYLSMRGYHSFDGDQTYRLPLLLHHQDPTVFAGDPFVRSFDAFNPHRGSILVLDMVTRPFGLSAGLFVLFFLTFSATCVGIDRLARAVWPAAGSQIGPVAVGLVLAAKAGNVGTNHLFEAMVLDRLMALALGWLALADAVARPDRAQARGMAAVALATLIHPSVGLQLALVMSASWLLWSLARRWTEVSGYVAIRAIVELVFAVIPGLAINLGPGSSLQGDLPTDVFWLLSVELQSPQHMLPHLWRMPQWLAWGCYLVLAVLAFAPRVAQSRTPPEGESKPTGPPVPFPAARARMALVIVVILMGLGAAWYAIEVLHQVRVTVFQPFRMATVLRGIALIFVADRLLGQWRSGGWLGRARAILIASAFSGDWLLVVVTSVEVAFTIVQTIRVPWPLTIWSSRLGALMVALVLALGLNFLAHHDTEYGNRTLLAAGAAGLAIGIWRRIQPRVDVFANGASRRGILVAAWLIPLASLLATTLPADWAASRQPLVRALINRCRFVDVPIDDVERLALWCRENTPASARLIGPPGPKTLRLWSRRSVAFNRAASPYHGAGLLDWFARFKDHVNFHGPATDFVRAYVGNRHGFEARYEGHTANERAALALRQGATFVVAAAPQGGDRAPKSTSSDDALEILHVEGRFAVYRVKPELLVQRQR